MSKVMFCSEVELGSFLGSIDLLGDAFRAFSDTSSSSSYELHTSSSGIQILAFNCPPDYTARFLNGEFGLVSSENLRAVDFIQKRVNGSFFINRAAVELFESLPPELKEIGNQLIHKPLIVTGRSLGGYAAILFALWLQHAVDAKEGAGFMHTTRPLCITFGSPLVGDEALETAISTRPRWKSNFLNVVGNTDPVASFLSSTSELEHPYKPFGTSLICTESGGHTAFEDQDLKMAVLDATTASSRAGRTETPVPDYGNHLKSMGRNVLLRGVSELRGDSNLNPLRAGITWQLIEIGVVDDISNDMITRTEEKQAKTIRSKFNRYEPAKKLNDSSLSMVYIEWYIRSRRPKGGYYDCYRNIAETKEESEAQLVIRKQLRALNEYWKEFADDNERHGGKLRKRWTYTGYYYRRIIEPLDIAEHYKKGRKDYLANRSDHYKLLERLWNEDKKGLNPNGRNKRGASLNEDSCFWAHVEEALIELRGLKNGEKLERFERYVMGEIKNYSLSPDVFLEGSSLMKWWSDYKQHKGSLYASELAEYMNGGKYKSYK